MIKLEMIKIKHLILFLKTVFLRQTLFLLKSYHLMINTIYHRIKLVLLILINSKNKLKSMSLTKIKMILLSRLAINNS